MTRITYNDIKTMSFNDLSLLAKQQCDEYNVLQEMWNDTQSHDECLKRIRKMTAIQKKNCYIINAMKIISFSNPIYEINWDLRINMENAIL